MPDLGNLAIATPTTLLVTRSEVDDEGKVSFTRHCRDLEETRYVADVHGRMLVHEL